MATAAAMARTLAARTGAIMARGTRARAGAQCCLSTTATASEASPNSSPPKKQPQPKQEPPLPSVSSTLRRQPPPQHLLYQRSSTFVPRALLVGTTLHTCYWTWYTADFVPAINASPIESMHIDPIMGYVGLVLGSILSAASLLYPQRLISEIAVLPGKKQHCLQVKTHTLALTIPWIIVKPSSMPQEFAFSDVYMDNKTDVKKLLETTALGSSSGDDIYKTFQGRHLGLRTPHQYLLLEIREKGQVLDNDQLLQVLLPGGGGGREEKNKKKPASASTPGGATKRKKRKLQRSLRRRQA